MNNFFVYKSLHFNKNPKIFKLFHNLIEDKRYIDNVIYISDKKNNSMLEIFKDFFNESKIYKNNNKFPYFINIEIQNENFDNKQTILSICNKYKKNLVGKNCIILDISYNLNLVFNIILNIIKDQDIIVTFDEINFFDADKKTLEFYHGINKEIETEGFYVITKLFNYENTYIKCQGG